jgi:hypothetical protein
MKRALTWLGLGAGLMYYLDPDRGRSRRTRVRDRILHLLKELDAAVGATAHDLTNRTHGLIAEARSVLIHHQDHTPDGVVVARVRSKLGRVVSHPHAIVVTAHRGHVALAGPVLACEVDRLRSAVASVRGVTSVEDRLQVYWQPGDHPALQGGTRRAGEPLESWQKTWPPTMRLLAGTAVGVAALGIAGHRKWAGLTLGALGIGLVAHELADGQRGRDRKREHFRAALTTGAPVHDVEIPIARSRTEALEIGL